MFNNGAIEEAKKYFKIKVNKDLSSNKIIGINEIHDYLSGQTTLLRAKELIRQKTRQYAKRQATWARSNMATWNRVAPKEFQLRIKKINFSNF